MCAQFRTQYTHITTCILFGKIIYNHKIGKILNQTTLWILKILSYRREMNSHDSTQTFKTNIRPDIRKGQKHEYLEI